ncbi:hypothetical protein GA069_15045 [Vibrio parahaemolyticus]|nr:hypothetical protein [Vibrio parahaemolyticus]
MASIVEVFGLSLSRQPVKLGSGGLNFLIRFLNALLASPQPLGNPVGKHNQMEHSASLAA